MKTDGCGKNPDSETSAKQATIPVLGALKIALAAIQSKTTAEIPGKKLPKIAPRKAPQTAGTSPLFTAQSIFIFEIPSLFFACCYEFICLICVIY